MRPTMNCECGNNAMPGESFCEYCEPHEHDLTTIQHDFTVNMLCRNCRLIAQDCCDIASECHSN